METENLVKLLSQLSDIVHDVSNKYEHVDAYTITVNVEMYDLEKLESHENINELVYCTFNIANKDGANLKYKLYIRDGYNSNDIIKDIDYQLNIETNKILGSEPITPPTLSSKAFFFPLEQKEFLLKDESESLSKIDYKPTSTYKKVYHALYDFISNYNNVAGYFFQKRYSFCRIKLIGKYANINTTGLIPNRFSRAELYTFNKTVRQLLNKVEKNIDDVRFLSSLSQEQLSSIFMYIMINNLLFTRSKYQQLLALAEFKRNTRIGTDLFD